jgi:hypothetical protein
MFSEREDNFADRPPGSLMRPGVLRAMAYVLP